MHLGGLTGCLNCRHSSLCFLARITEPVRTPDAMEAPTQAFKHLLTQAVAVTRRTRAVITGAIALDSQYITPGIIRIFHSDIDEITRRTHLRLHLVTALTQGQHYFKLKRGVSLPASFPRDI